MEVEEPEGRRRVWEALGAQQAQLQPPPDVLLHLGGPGRPRVHAVLELHVAAGGQELHWVSATLRLRSERGRECGRTPRHGERERGVCD